MRGHRLPFGWWTGIDRQGRRGCVGGGKPFYIGGSAVFLPQLLDIAKLQTLLADPELYTREPAKFEKANTLLARAEEDRSASEEEWLRLEMLREELEG